MEVDDRQLGWLQYNRWDADVSAKPPHENRHTERKRWWRQERRGSVRNAGEVAAELLAGQGKLSGIQQQVWVCLEECFGSELTEQITGVGVRRGVLVLAASEPAVVYHLRLEWQQRILQAVQYGLPGCGIWKVRFETSAAG